MVNVSNDTTFPVFTNVLGCTSRPGFLESREMLTAGEINELRQLESILQPFMAAQRALEGQKYVSNSLVAYIIHTIRSRLGNILNVTEDDAFF